MWETYIDLSEIRHWLDERITDPIVRILRRTKMTPNILTSIGFFVSVIAAVAIGFEYLFIGGLLVLFSGLFDMLDGALARAQNESTVFGAFLDSTLDRLSEAALLLGLLLMYLNKGANTEVWVVYVTLVGSIVVSYTRARAEGLGIDCKVGFCTRPERVIVLAIGLLLNWVFVALCIIAALAWITFLQRFVHIWRQTKDLPAG